MTAVPPVTAPPVDPTAPWRAAITGLLCCVPLVPLVVTPWLYHPYITGKAFAFRVGIEVALAGWLVLHALAPGSGARRRPSPIDRAGALFLAALALSTAASQDVERSFWSTFERMEGLIGHLHLAALYVLLVTSLTSRRQWHVLLHISLAASVAAGIAAWVMGGERLSGPVGNPSFLATYAAMHAILAAWMWVRAAGYGWRAHLYLGVAAVQLAVLYGTGSRGAVAGLGVAGCVAAVGAAYRGTATAPRAVALACVGLLVVLGLWANAPDSPHALPNRLLATSASSEARLGLWSTATDAVAERWWLGWGMENFPLVLGRHRPPPAGMEGWADRAHTGVLDHAVSAGVAAACGYVLLYAAAVWTVWRPASRHVFVDRVALTALFAAHATCAAFSFDDLASYVVLVALLAYGAVCDGGDAPQAAPRPWLLTPWRVGVAAVVVGAAVWTVHTVNVRPCLAARHLRVAADPGAPGEDRVAGYREVFALRTFGSREATASLATTVVLEVLPSATFAPDVRRDLLALARLEVGRLAAMYPADARTQELAGVFSANVGDAEAALVCLERAARAAPFLPRVVAGLAKVQARAGDARALATARHAYALDPALDEALLVYVEAATLHGDIALADSVLRAEARHRPPALLDRRIVEAYLTAGRSDALLALWLEEAERNDAFKKRLGRFLERHRGGGPSGTPRSEASDRAGRPAR